MQIYTNINVNIYKYKCKYIQISGEVFWTGLRNLWSQQFLTSLDFLLSEISPKAKAL